MNYQLKHLLLTTGSVLSVGAGMFVSGYALHAEMAALSVAAGMVGGAGLLAMGLFIFYFSD
jgi:hypothetical protein